MDAGLPLRLIRLALAALLAWALVGCASLDERLRMAIYRPSRDVPAAPPAALKPDDQRWWVEVPGNPAPRGVTSGPASQKLQLWWLPAHPDAPALLYLHGTFRNLYRNLPKIQALREAGFSVLAVEYRGWGESSPIVPSEQSIHADAALAWRELVQRQPEPRKRFIFGHSMGGAVAVHLASGTAATDGFAGLILESTFTSLPDVAAQRFAPAWLFAQLFGETMNAGARIGTVKAPLLMLHGTADKTVPFVLGQRLFAAAPEPKRFIVFDDGMHSDLHATDATRYRESLQAFRRELQNP